MLVLSLYNLYNSDLHRDMAGLSTARLSTIIHLIATLTGRSSISLSSRLEMEEEGDLRRDLVSPLQIPDGFDLRTGERQEDGQFCVFKNLELEGL